MTKLLERAIAEACSRPESEQDAIASMILNELADDRRWDETFARTQDKLARLAQKACQDVRERTSSQGISTLAVESRTPRAAFQKNPQ